MRPIGRPGAILSGGLAILALTAFMPAGLDGRRVPALSFIWWSAVLVGGIAVLSVTTRSPARVARSVAWMLPPVLLLTLPAVVFAAAAKRADVAPALIVRALAAATAALATVTVLGPSGLVAGLAALRVPPRLVEVVHAMLVGLAAIVRQASGMLRARAARRTHRAPWSAMAMEPIATVRGFGRLVGALLLRSLERAESLERARRARGGGDA